eukprot:NODE_7530_length_1570_cov_7.487872.p1 GENE.NODE_7530_length_1570_cov_7.487872~~NODE_7530_length_1570_cov_7.487872.p1  ORF type:complete len:445 (+),score=123.89 NODE_7530_length_1570_cov_7.487872:173-1507(+)
MKVKVLQRSEQELFGEPGGVPRSRRNPDPRLHPLERAREYQRALTATKIEKIFAKPFVKALDGHTDSVKCLSIALKPAAPLVSGGCDGWLRLWDLRHFECCAAVHAHSGFVRDAVVAPRGDRVFSCGDDRTVKVWDLQPEARTLSEQPSLVFQTVSILNSVDHHRTRNQFVTAGDTVDVWDSARSTPVNSFEWGCDRVITARFNPAEPSLIGSTAVDRSIGLFDLRGNSAIRKVVLKMRSNALRWNPMEPLNFVVANEDCSLYTFDMRKLSGSLQQHHDHVMPVVDVGFSPTGQEMVSAGYDGTVRIWPKHGDRSRDVYHGKRMQRVLCCSFTPDGRFVLSGSEDTNIRIWKAKSDQKLGVLSTAETKAQAYREALKERYQRLPEIRRIKNHRHVPKLIKSLTNKRRIMLTARVRKEDNRRKHSKPGSVTVVPRKKRPIVREVE